jgi:hypothetical protein
VAWTTLWDAEHDPCPNDAMDVSLDALAVSNLASRNTAPRQESREFSPTLRQLSFLTNVLRIELDHSNQQ